MRRGVAQSWFLPDNENYTNVQFDLARAQQPLGFIKNNTYQADYNTTVNSWLEQRKILTSVSTVVADAFPQFAARLDKALRAIAAPVLPSTAGYALINGAAGHEFSCGSLRVTFDATGAIAGLTDTNSGTAWAGTSNVLGRFLYQSFTNEDYNVFLQDFAARIGSCKYKPGSPDDMGCGNFRKPNVTSANPRRRQLVPSMNKLYQRPVKDGCEFIVMVRLFAAGNAHGHHVPGWTMSCSLPCDAPVRVDCTAG